MNNFINVRIKPYNAAKEKNDIKHNLRTVNTQSKVDENFQGLKNKVINFQDEKPLTVLKKWRAEHNTKYKKRLKENLTDKNSTLINGIISFSEKIHTDFNNKYSQEEFENANINAIKEIAEFLGTEIMYVSFHYDEKTPHVHYHFKNFDEQGRSIFYKNRTKEQLEKLQDIGFKHLGKLGMERGIKKDTTNKTHQTTQVYYRKLYKEYNDNLKSLRNELKSLEINADEKKKLYSDITNMQKQLREHKNDLDNYQDELKIFDKILDNQQLTNDEIEVLKILAPSLFQFIENSTSKKKQELSNSISKTITRNNI
jgi:hypothetical protein